MVDNTLSAGIKFAREQAGLTQSQLAEKIGTTPQNISQYERGIRRPKIETIARIASALKRSPFDLIPYNDASTDIFIRKNNALEELAISVKVAEIRAEKVDGVKPDEKLRKKILDEKIQQVSKRYIVPAEVLEVDASECIDELWRNLHEKGDSISTLPELQKRMLNLMDTMTPAGQQTAVDRVEELAQIPKYQRTQTAQQDTPAGLDDKEPAEK